MKLYADEIGADVTRELSTLATARFTSMVTYAEMRAAFARKRKFGQITDRALRRHKSEFERDWIDFEALPVDEIRARRAGELAEAYGLRGFDAIHLASADRLRQSFGEITFACFDAEPSRAASSCGMMLLPSI